MKKSLTHNFLYGYDRSMQLDNRFYTSTEVANILGVSLRSVYRYLEEGKIEADVKTATGRHRFTRQNILDFLYPKSDSTPQQNQQQSQQPQTAQQEQPASVSPQQVSVSIESQTIETPDAVIQTTQTQQTVVEPHSEEQAQPEQASETFAEQEAGEQVSDADLQTQVAQTAQTEEQPEEQQTEQQNQTDEQGEDEPVDWLAKFREAAEKYKAEQQQREEQSSQTSQAAQPIPTPSPAPATAPVQEPVSQVSSQQATPVQPEQTISQETPAQEKEPETKSEYYYTSGVGGLKDIAQQLDKSAKKADVEYAFTMNAGLSLFKPIKPFSLLHAYVRPQDREYYEKSLKLSETSKQTAQLCLIMSDDRSLYSSKVDMHGLNVVSKDRLRKDLIDAGEQDLVNELDSLS